MEKDQREIKQERHKGPWYQDRDKLLLLRGTWELFRQVTFIIKTLVTRFWLVHGAEWWGRQSASGCQCCNPGWGTGPCPILVLQTEDCITRLITNLRTQIQSPKQKPKYLSSGMRQSRLAARVSVSQANGAWLWALFIFHDYGEMYECMTQI